MVEINVVGVLITAQAMHILRAHNIMIATLIVNNFKLHFTKLVDHFSINY